MTESERLLDTAEQSDRNDRNDLDYRASGDVCKLPSVFELMYPPNLWGFIRGYVECWCVSRPWHRLPLALPFVAVVLGGAGFIWWLRTAPKDRIVENYVAAVDAATRANDPEPWACTSGA